MTNKLFTTVVNIRTSTHTLYIGRPKTGKPWGFGNPFIVGRDGTHDDCVDKFSRWLGTGNNNGNPDATNERRQWILYHIPDLEGHQLGCFCKPNACHGDTLVAILNEHLWSTT